MDRFACDWHRLATTDPKDSTAPIIVRIFENSKKNFSSGSILRIASLNDAGLGKNGSEKRPLKCGSVLELSARVMVHPVSNPLHIGPGKEANICTLGHKSPDQNIGSFIGTTLIGAVWMRIVDLCSAAFSPY